MSTQISYQFKQESTNFNLKDADKTDCLMKKARLYNNETAKFFSLKINEKDKALICEECFFKCNQVLEDNELYISQIHSVKEVSCSCLHAKKGFIEESDTCSFKELGLALNIHFFVEVTLKEINKATLKEDSITKTVCFGCFVGCFDSPTLPYRILEQKNDLKCHCNKCNTKKPGEDNLSKILESYKTESRVNCHLIFKTFIENSKLRFASQKEIRNLFNAIKIESKNNTPFNELFYSVQSKLKLFQLGIQMGDIPKDFILEKDFLIQEFIHYVNKYQNRPKISDSVFVGYKYYLLYFLRQLLLKPLLIRSPFAKLAEVNNASPFHRQLFRMSFDSFLKKSHENGLDIDCTSIIALLSIGPINSIPANDPNYVNLFIEYLKWCCMLCSLDFKISDTTRRREMTEMKRYVIVGLSMLSLNIRRGKVKLRKEDDARILKYIVKLFKMNLIKYNDKVFFNFLKVNQGNKDLREGLKFFFENTPQINADNDPNYLMKELKMFYSMFFSEKQEIRVDSDIYELLLGNDDGYISSLKNIIEFNDPNYLRYLHSKMLTRANTNRKDKVKGRLTDIESYSKSIADLIQLITESNTTSDAYIGIWIKGIEEKCEKAKAMNNSFDETDEVDFIGDPYFNILFAIYSDFKDNPSLKSLLGEEAIKKIHTAIHAIFENFMDNPFILPLFFTESTMKVISCYDNIAKKTYLNAIQMDFYSKAIAKSIKQGYPIELYEITSLICNSPIDVASISKQMRDSHNSSGEPIIIDETVKTSYKSSVELIGLKLQLINKILKTCTTSVRMKINDLAFHYISSLHYLLLLKLNYFELSEKERAVFLGIFQILNQLNDYYYLLLPKEQIINEHLTQLIDQLSLKLADCNDKEDKADINNAYIILNIAVIRSITISSFEVYPKTITPLLQNRKSSTWELTEAINNKLSKSGPKEETPKEAAMGFGRMLLDNAKIIQLREKQAKDYEKYLNDTIQPLITNLEKFRLHCQGIENYPNEMFNHFEELILIPTTYLLYDLLYFSENINATIKYHAYKIVFLFFNCYKYFTSVILMNFLPSSVRALKFDFKSAEGMFGQNLYLDTTIIKETINLIRRKFVFANKNEELEIFFQNLHDSLEIDLLNIEKTPLDLTVLLVKYSKYASFFIRMQFLPKIKLNEFVFFTFENKQIKAEAIKKEEESNAINREVLGKMKDFVSLYRERKEDSSNNFLLDFFEKDIEDQQETYTYVIRDLVKKLVLTADESFNDKFFAHFGYINKIFKANPGAFQKYFLDNKKHFHIIQLVKSQLPLIYQLTMIEYHKLNDFTNDPREKAIETFVALLEFLRLLCENHFQKMQMIIANELFEEQFRLIHFIVQVPSLTQKHHFKSISRVYLGKYFKEHLSEYFKPLISKVMDFNIELIQGSLAGKELIQLAEAAQSNSKEKKVIFNEYFKLYLTSATVAYESCQDLNNLFYLSEFLRFIVSFLEEPANSDADKKELIGYFNVNRIIDFMVFCTKELYANLPNKTEAKNKNGSDYIDDLTQGYIEHHDYFENNPYFTIAFSSMKYLELASALSVGSKVQILMKEARVRFKENAHIYELWSEVTFRFFFTIMKTVDFSLEFTYYDLNDTPSNQKVLVHNIFLVHPDVQLVTEKDYGLFYEEAPFEDQNLKLGYLLKFLPKLEEMISTRKSIKKQHPIVDVLSRMNYKATVIISALIALATSSLIMFSSSYATIGPDGLPLDQELIQPNEVNSNIIFWLGLGHLAFLFMVCSNWLYFNVYVAKATQADSKSNSSVVSYMGSGIQFFLFWNFFWGALALFPLLRFCHSFQLFALFGLFDTMRTVLISVKMRYKQFIAAAFLIVIFSLFFASVKYSVFCADNTAEACQRFSFSFLNMITSGIRAGNNVGFDKVSITDSNYYWYFFIEWVFYFILILVMLNIINGIIVDTFQEQREKNNERSQAKENICYICNTERSYFEKEGINYEDHANYTHSIIHYFEYLVSLKRINELDLNSLDSVILQQLKQNQTGFFPPQLTKDD